MMQTSLILARLCGDGAVAECHFLSCSMRLVGRYIYSQRAETPQPRLPRRKVAARRIEVTFSRECIQRDDRDLESESLWQVSLTLCVRPMSICMCVWVFGEVPLCVLEGLFREFRWDESCIDRPNYLQLQIVVVVLSISLLWNTHTYEEIALMRNRIEWWDITFLSRLF